MVRAVTRKNLVSIMIPTYNRPIMFEQALLSALSQDYKHIEIIVCDNSTNDETEQLIKKYLADKRLTYIRNREAKTKAENFMPFENLAHGEYLQWLMDDDMLHPAKLTKMVNVLKKNSEVALVSSQRQVIDKDGHIVAWYPADFPVKEEYSIYPSEFIAWKMLKNAANIIGEPSATLFRRKDLRHHYWQAECKGYRTISDVVMWLELLEKGSLAIFRDALSFFRRHEEQEGQGIDVVILSRIEWYEINNEYFERKVFPYTEDDYKHFLSVMVEEYKKKMYVYKEAATSAVWQRYMAMIESAARVTVAVTEG